MMLLIMSLIRCLRAWGCAIHFLWPFAVAILHTGVTNATIAVLATDDKLSIDGRSSMNVVPSAARDDIPGYRSANAGGRQATPSAAGTANSSVSNYVWLNLSTRSASMHLSPAVQAGLHIIVETVPGIATGGPEALAQAVHAFKSVGVEQLVIVNDVRDLYSHYAAGVPLWNDIKPAGSVVFTGESAVCHPERGVKHIKWALSDAWRPDDKGCVFIGHSLYTRDFLDLPATGIMRPFVSTHHLDGAPRTVEEAAQHKRNLVLVDNDIPDAIPMLRDALQPIFADIEVVELAGLPYSAMPGLYRAAKVVIDGDMVGAERAVSEGAAYWAVPLIEATRNGLHPLDFPVSNAYRFDFHRCTKVEQKEGHHRSCSLNATSRDYGSHLSTLVEMALRQWSTRAAGASPLIHYNRALPQLMLTDTARLLDASLLHVHVVACSSDGGLPAPLVEASALLVAAAVHYAAPLASVSIHINESRKAFWDRHQHVINAGQRAFSVYALTDVVEQSALCTHPGPAGAAEALAHLPYGKGEFSALLSWRALPLVSDAITDWLWAARAGPSQRPCSVSTLVVNNGTASVPMGVLVNQDIIQDNVARVSSGRAGLPIHVDTDAGTVSLQGPVSGPACTTRLGQGPREKPAILDTLPFLGASSIGPVAAHVPVDTACQLLLDPASTDVLLALRAAGQELPSGQASHGPCGEASGLVPRPITSSLCSHPTFWLIAARAGVEGLCGPG